MAIADRLENTKNRLAAYEAAEIAVLSGQEYKIANRTLRRADLEVIRTAIKELQNMCDELEAAISSGGKRRAYRIVPRDL